MGLCSPVSPFTFFWGLQRPIGIPTLPHPPPPLRVYSYEEGEPGQVYLAGFKPIIFSGGLCVRLNCLWLRGY